MLSRLPKKLRNGGVESVYQFKKSKRTCPDARIGATNNFVLVPSLTTVYQDLLRAEAKAALQPKEFFTSSLLNDGIAIQSAQWVYYCVFHSNL